MDMPEWLTDIIIVLIVVLVIGLIVYNFFPSTWEKVSSIADEVFGLTTESKDIEATELSIDNMVFSFGECITNNMEGCYCNLKRDKIPENFKIWLANVDNGVRIAGLTDQDAATGNPKVVEGVRVGLAIVSQGSLQCQFEDITLRNLDGKITIKSKYEFYTGQGIAIPEILKLGNDLCFVTTALEAEIPVTDPAKLRFIAKISQNGKEEISNEEIMRAITSIGECSNVADADRGIAWPVSTGDIDSVSSCNAVKDGTGAGVRLKVTAGSPIKSPFEAGIVTEYCLENCRGEPYVIIYQVYNNIKKWPTGFYSKISGISSLTGSIKKEAANSKVTPTSIEGASVSATDVIGAAKNEITFAISYKSMPSNEFASLVSKTAFLGDASIRNILCELPRLKAEKYSGEGCAEIVISNGCGLIADTSYEEIRKLGRSISALQDKEKGQMLFVLNEDYNIVGFEKGQEGSGCSGSTAGKIKKPKSCEGKSCICLCEEPRVLNINPDCGTTDCYEFEDFGFSPLFMKGGDECDKGPYIQGFRHTGSRDGVPVINVYFERSGYMLGLCSKPPCIISQ